jgi:hypothetical protein
VGGERSFAARQGGDEVAPKTGSSPASNPKSRRDARAPSPVMQAWADHLIDESDTELAGALIRL